MNKQQRTGVYLSNKGLVENEKVDVPDSFKITWASASKDYNESKEGEYTINDKTGVYFEYMKTDECAKHYIDSGFSENVCVMNFASRFNHGGGYKRGARAQEEDLCRTIPALYHSLCGVRYPFEEDSIVITPDLTLMRENHRYRLLHEKQMVNFSVVSAAAPRLRSEKFDENRVRRTLINIFLSVKKHLPKTDTLILGAWGCGAYGNDPIVMSKIMNEITWEFGGLYKYIVFSVPKGVNTKEFEANICTLDCE